MAWDVTVLSGVRVLKALLTLDLSRQIDRVRIDNALQTLRQIFFYSTDLIDVLEEIEAGNPADPEVVEHFASEFANLPYGMQHSLEFIENERFEDRNILRIDDLDILQQIRSGKLDARREVSRFFRSYQRDAARRGRHFSRDATLVLGQIERLNTLIKNLEKKLLAARGSGAPPARTTRSRAREV